MSKFYISGESSHPCTVQVFTTTNHNYIGQLIVEEGAHEVVFELDVIENVDVWAKKSDGNSTSYIDVVPLDGSAKAVNITYEYTEVHGGDASTY
jgi:hypothetical protein